MNMLETFKYYKLASLAAGVLLTGVPHLAEAQMDEPLCVKDEYVLSVVNIPALQDKALEAIESVSRKELEIAEAGTRAILIKSEDAPNGESLEDKDLVHSDTPSNLCEKLKRVHRAQLLDRRLTGDTEILRKFNCSCNGKIQLAASPNDPMVAYQWGVHNSSDTDMNLPEAWDTTTGSADVVVAVIDTGIDYNHVDLKNDSSGANIWINSLEIPGNGIDDDGNGYVDDIHGINAINGSGNPMDDHYHGTHVAGTIGAKANNGVGVAGVAWNVKLMGVKFLSSTGGGTLYDGIEAVDYVTNMKNRGVNVVASNNSWGWGAGYWQPMYDAIDRARRAGVLFVGAAGNAANNSDSNPHYPGSFQLDNVISVAALTSAGSLASFSNYGANSVHIAAPGHNIASTYPGNSYYYLNGTSMASPHVAGAVALLKAYSPGLNYSQIRNYILQSAKVLPALQGKVSTNGTADAAAMLRLAPYVPAGPVTPTPTPQPTATPIPPTPIPTPTPTPTPIPGWYNVSGMISAGDVKLAGAKIVLQTANGTYVAFADINGNYFFNNILGPSAYTLTITKSGYSRLTYTGTLDGDQNISFTPEAKIYSLNGFILDGSGDPLEGAVIDAGSLGQAYSDANGAFSFNIAYGKKYKLEASLPEFSIRNNSAEGTVYGNLSRVIIAERN